MQYESERALFEAFGRNKYEQATGVIHWKLNGAWPSLIWNLYGYDLVPGGAYFGVKKANEILHIQYSYDDRSVVVVNDGPTAITGLHARASIHDLDGSERFSADAQLDMPEDSVQSVLVLPEIENPSPTYFVKLSLEDASGRTVSDNFYWLSSTPEVIDWSTEGSTDRWWAPATLQFGDFTALGQLPVTSISATAYGSRDTDLGQVRVDLANNSPTVAFFLQLELSRGEEGPEVAPVLWEDNDFSLMPGETRSVVVSYRVADLGGAEPALRLSGWNVPRTSVPLTSGALAISRLDVGLH
jgi:exo-1,4-beta-D-glucosaminidase